ncbi:hypothetical protein FB566_0678 [Stackebrandtia endophytica]|uniref:Uncharacterized protein n=1 Tax=Stackebrandtia endophytica TaxID=1496996 RepID=A0A543ARH4_9ACTN|nr:hypothetical protein [Stackebrandtia endophytica]TQL75182.1 hypothetical protein FB566_0678 [Stackebrandtia endophytica]
MYSSQENITNPSPGQVEAPGCSITRHTMNPDAAVSTTTESVRARANHAIPGG